MVLCDMNSPSSPAPENTDSITFGAGCFWCTEAVFQQLPGVLSVTSGYMGGATVNPTYEQICEGDTGHAEVSRIVFDATQTTLDDLLAAFWKMHDPTTPNRQGNDVGTQYRSAVFYHDDKQRAAAEASKEAAVSQFDRPIVTEIAPATKFYPAEDYHQDYYNNNKSRNPYCAYVITPKLKKLQLAT